MWKVLLCYLASVGLTVGEGFFQQRNREDLVRYRVFTDHNVVTSIEKAEQVLVRYGYLRCGLQQYNQQEMSNKILPEEGPYNFLQMCSEKEITEAVKQYQRTYNMPETGRLDSATLRVMSESRCGNPDDESLAPSYRPMIKRRRKYFRRNRARRTKREVPLSNEPPTRPTIESGTIEDSRRAKPFSDMPKGTTVSRRKRWLENYIQQIESGELEKKLHQMHGHIQSRRRKKRSISPSVEGQAFPAEVVTWRLIGSAYSNQLTANTQRATLALAFRMWSEVIPLVFQEDIRSPVDDVDILIAFGRGEHMNCPNHFDGYGGQLSHAIKMSSNAEIHVDDDEYLTVGSDQGTNLVKVAVHEVGHALGLFHTSRNYSIMYAIYSQVIPNNNFELGWEDRKMIQEVYGVCKGRFDTVFDWVRRRPDGQLIYNTYFFRENRYWMYENRYNRTRYGDPLQILPEWKGIPNSIDGYAHVWTYTNDVAYFFKGQYYYVYNSAEDRVAQGYPRNISEDFRAIPGSGYPNIPGNLDSVFFDKRDGNLYFFKDNLVYAYDVSRGTQGCCLPGYPREINKEFPSASPAVQLPNHIDAVFYSYTDRSMYFFKGNYYWQNLAFNPLDRRRMNRMSGPREISTKWFDICDVDV